ncbi:hypothetical protein [Modestobacter italicus]|uniref:hypothetical protein n=1 Tax=Modestobacter italicus (strain DSM 44449 / CECT 9708 / BC 501) TaxID=2732864 RepID=UPI0005A1DC65|nr:hypothetical protein [Modestobacter marinus]
MTLSGCAVRVRQRAVLTARGQSLIELVRLLTVTVGVQLLRCNQRVETVIMTSTARPEQR